MAKGIVVKHSFTQSLRLSDADNPVSTVTPSLAAYARAHLLDSPYPPDPQKSIVCLPLDACGRNLGFRS
jgi:hypothetical protein